MAESEKPIAAVYVSWTTFANSINQLSKGEIPNVIDKTVFTGMAFSIQNQLFTGMRFLGLIDDKNKPTKDLEELATPIEDERKEKLKQILHRKYQPLFALNLKKTTPAELEKTMTESYSVNGDTRDRAVRFFTAAAEYVGTDLSPLLSSKKANGGQRATRKQRQRRNAPSPAPVTDGPVGPPGTSKMVRLQSGGNLTLSATLDFFSLNAEDRKFVFELIDKLDGYQQPANPKTEPGG